MKKGRSEVRVRSGDDCWESILLALQNSIADCRSPDIQDVVWACCLVVRSSFIHVWGDRKWMGHGGVASCDMLLRSEWVHDDRQTNESNRIESFFLNWSLDEFMIIFVEFVDFDSRKPQTHGETVIACNAQ